MGIMVLEKSLILLFFYKKVLEKSLFLRKNIC